MVPLRPRRLDNSAPASEAPLSNGDDAPLVHTATVNCTATGSLQQIAYTNRGAAGKGSFGVVRKVQLDGTETVLAVKRTRQDHRFKNRELQLMLHPPMLSHANIVKLRYWYYEAHEAEDSDDEDWHDGLYLNLFLDYLPETVYQTYRSYTQQGLRFPEFLVKLYTHQLLRALAYVHSMSICHRDLKPHNLVVDSRKGILFLIDFGSAKVLRSGEDNVAYTCSRFYRAPELIFGSAAYTNSIDLWSVGCIVAELLMGAVFFAGSSAIDQLVEIIKILGTPTTPEIDEMNPGYAIQHLPKIKPVPLSKVLMKSSKEAVHLVKHLLLFHPSHRLSACEALAHPFFDDLKIPGATLLDGSPLPRLFDFSRHELSIRPDLIRQLVPPHTEQALWDDSAIDVANFTPMDLTPLMPSLL